MEMTEIVRSLEHGARCYQAGQLPEAEQFYRKVLEINPSEAAALHRLSLIAYQTGRYDEALKLVTEAVKSTPTEAGFHNSMGLILEGLGRCDEAVTAYGKAVALKPGYYQAYHNVAVAMVAQGSYAAAADNCKKAISLNPGYAQAWNTMGYALEKQGKTDEAIECYRYAVNCEPDFVEPYNHLGVLLNEKLLHEQAAATLQKAIEIDPEYAEVYSNLGIALNQLERFDDAIENFRHAIRLDPNFCEAHYNLANSLRDKGLCKEAVEHYKRAIELNSDYAQAYWNLSLTLLLSGNFADGWPLYKWRRNADLRVLTNFHRSGKSRWDGSSFAGKSLFVHYEQGLGDNIQFARYLPMVKARGGTVIFQTLKPVIGLLHGFPGIDRIVEYNPDESVSYSFDIYASLLDMPQIFGTTVETIPAVVPYIFADASKTHRWAERITEGDFKIGIAWAGSPTHGNDRYRSCSLEDFARLADIAGVRLYSLQKGQAAEQIAYFADTINVVDLGKDFADFTDTAAAVENLDVVVSVDTSVLHLAGAMGKTVWALLPFAPDWRWMLEREDSPWYPTMKLFRQQTLGQWEPVFERIAEAIKMTAAERKRQMQENWI